MALEGWGISDNRLEQIALNYEAQGMDRLVRKIAEQSNKTKKPLSEVAKEVMDEFWKRKAHFKRD